MSAHGRRRLRGLGAVMLGLIALGAVGACGKTVSPSRGGLMLIVSVDGSLPVGRLDVSVTSNGTPLLSHNYKVPEEAQLPTSIALVSNGDPTGQATISITGWEVIPGQPDVPLDRRDAIVTQIPTDRVAELRVVLSASCTKWVDGSGQPACIPKGYTCDGTGNCVPPDVVATDLGVYQTGDEMGVGGSSTATGGSGGDSAAGTGAGAASGGGNGGGGALCGNGMLEGTERCDDGNTGDGDGCSSTCNVEQGWDCGQAEPSTCAPTCGDGLVLGAEAKPGGCDDKNKLPNDGCSATCQVEAGYVCSGAPSVCAKTCGNGKVEAGETCDDANAVKGDGCFACAIETGYSCDPTKVPTKCTDDNECTNGTSNCSANATCTNTPGSFTCACNSGYSGSGVTCTTVCGDGIKAGTEPCDDGGTVAGDGCSATCTLENGFTCDTTKMPTKCTDVNECTNNTNNCDLNATCTNNPGGFTCACKGGYTGNGVTCSASSSSCAGLTANCGSSSNDDCCAAPTVTGGTFQLGGTSSITSATIASFALDKYEITVGRYRKFVAAYTGPPAANAGAHPLIAGSGWQTAWNSAIGATSSALAAGVQCDPTYQTWDTSGAKDRLPIACVTWYEAFAFCAWDGGRLPTEAEWEYAAAGGASEFPYPWGKTPVPDDAQDATAAYANYNGLGDGSAAATYAIADILPVGSKPAGHSLYSQLDMAGSMWEWVLDWYAPYPTTCTNCANLTVATDRSIRGGNWYYGATQLTTTFRNKVRPPNRDNRCGFRCARSL